MALAVTVYDMSAMEGDGAKLTLIVDEVISNDVGVISSDIDILLAVISIVHRGISEKTRPLKSLLDRGIMVNINYDSFS